MSNFGEILRRLRKNSGMTQDDLAKVLCISKSTVSGYEQDWRFPTPDMLVRIANVFHVSTDYLLGREKERRVIVVSGLHEEDVNFLSMTIKFLEEKNDNNDNMQLT